MFNLLKCIINDVVVANSLNNNPIVMSNFDINNALNTLQRQHLNNQMTAGCPINLDAQKQMMKWLEPALANLQGTLWNKGILKFCPAGQTEHILSETGTQQGDQLGNVLFSAPFHPIFIDIADNLIPYLSLSLLILLLSSED